MLFYSISSYSQSSKFDSIQKNNNSNRTFYFQADLLLPVYSLVSNSVFERQSYLYNLTVGKRILVTQTKKIKKSIQLTIYNYTESNYTYGFNVWSGKVKTKKNDFFVTPEIKFLFNKEKFNNGFYIATGIGAGRYNYYENDTLKERKNAWDLLASVGYVLSIKRFYIDFKFGAGSYFSYKITDYNRTLSSYTAQEYYENIKKNNLDPSLKSVEYLNSSTIVYRYKYLGLMKTTFFPNFGIHIGICF